MEALERCREAGIPAVAYGNAPELRGYDRAYSDHRVWPFALRAALWYDEVLQRK